MHVPAPLAGVTTDGIEPAVLRELRSLGHDRAERVALHLASAMAALEEDETDTAVEQADAAVTLAPRLGVVRETAGLVRYRAGDFAHALRELRTARRMGSGPELIPVMVDCERAIGRHARALELAQEAGGLDLDRSAQVELAMVVAGTRRDLGDLPAALRALDLPELQSAGPASVRLRYAYADLLQGAGRTEEALIWFTRVAQVDAAGETDAAERVLAAQGLSIDSLEDEQVDDGDDAGNQDTVGTSVDSDSDSDDDDDDRDSDGDGDGDRDRDRDSNSLAAVGEDNGPGASEKNDPAEAARSTDSVVPPGAEQSAEDGAGPSSSR